MFDTVIFDLDGTLLDTSPGIVESVRHTIDVLGFEPLTEEALFSFIGPPLRQSFLQTCGCGPEEAQRAVDVFRAYYQDGALLNARPYDGIYELCRRLEAAGVRMAVATNKPERFAVRLLEHFGFHRYCRPIRGADEAGTLRKADLIRACVAETGADPRRSVLIGDTANDGAGAQEAGVDFLAVTYGFGFRTEKDASGYPCIGAAETPARAGDILLNGK